jgi:colicin import membrane protein
VPFGLAISLLAHAALLGWAYLAGLKAPPLPTDDTPAISAEIITPSEFLRLKQGSEDAKNLETRAKEEPKPEDSKNDTKKPDNAPPPPPQEVAKAEPEPTPPEPVKEEPPPPPPEPAKEEPPPPPPGPTPDEQKLLEKKIEDERLAAEAAKLAEEKRKQAEEEAKKKKAAEEARKKAEAAKKQFDPNKIASLLDKAPDDSTPKALIDKDPNKKGQQASGTSQTAEVTGQEAGTATGTDTVLSAREQDLLKGMIKRQISGCWRPPGTAGGTDAPVVKLEWQFSPDGSLATEPRVIEAPSTPAGQVYAEAAVRAVKTCAPFSLPPDRYEGGWKDIRWTFDPREML